MKKQTLYIILGVILLALVDALFVYFILKI